MHLIALITKWRGKDVQFLIEFPEAGIIQLSVNLLREKKYFSIRADDLEYACTTVDYALTQHCGGSVDNNHINS